MRRFEVDTHYRVFFDSRTGNDAAVLRSYPDGDMQIHTTSGGIRREQVDSFIEWLTKAVEEVLTDPNSEENRSL